MAEPKKKGFWNNLFRSKSAASKGEKLEKDPLRRVSEGDVLGRNRRPERPERHERPDRPDGPSDVPPRRRRPRRTDPHAAKGKGREDPSGSPYDLGPLTEWPPSGMPSSEELNLGPAMQLISRGVPAFKGHKRPIPHQPDYHALFATAAGNRGDETDAANQHDSMTQLMTLRLTESGPATYPWETLEQPSYSFCFGKRPGTITLNHWVSLASAIPPAIKLRDPGVPPREIDFESIFERLRELDRGLEDDDEELMYRNLYKRLLKDPDKYMNPHKTLDIQITDLLMVLSRPGWIDFTVPKNQVVTKFIFDTSAANTPTYQKFFHQLLLSLELELRIQSRHHMTEAKEKLLTQIIPPTIQWNLALARRWRDNIRVDAYGSTPEHVQLRYKLKRRQVKMLKRFAQMMKWPNLAETLASLKRRDADSTLDLVSSHAMAFFSGLVLPGPTFPFLIMNSLIDIDPDRATDSLTLLTHAHPSCGFQYRASYTYWTATSIVGKVLAPTCRSLAGWVGPARPTTDLGRNQIARIRARRPPSRITPEDMRSMSERSDPLGPPAQVFPVKEYALVAPDRDDDAYLADLVRIELLNLRACPESSRTTTSLPPPSSPAPGQQQSAALMTPRYYDASIQFAIDGVSWPLRLAFDVSFISAWPCSDGPHPLFFDYVYTPVKADELVKVRDWNGLFNGGGGSGVGGPQSRMQSRDGPPGATRSLTPPVANGGGVGVGAGAGVGVTGVSSPSTLSGGDEERVLVVEAFGVPDNEVLARAWCAHWGLSAVVADLGRTCMACAIREAYAAAVTVVILVDDEQDRRED